MNLKQLGAYLIDAATILTLFLKSAWIQGVATILNAIGAGLETGSGSIGPITIPNLQSYASYVVDAGALLALVLKAQWASTVSAFLESLGAAIAVGGTSSPIRIGNEQVTFSVSGDKLSAAYGPWVQQPSEPTGKTS
jgi:hypothetical protein